jgi:LysM repeat protein
MKDEQIKSNNKFKNKISKIAVAVAAAFLVAPVTTGLVELNGQRLPVVKAAKGDRGTDQSKYQGAQGRTAYGDEKFQINQMGGTVNGYTCYDQWTYPIQTAATIARGMRAHNYIWWQNVTTNWQADQVLNYFLPKVQTPKGSIIALDVEAGYQNTQAIQHACDRIREAGYTPMVYGYKNYLLNHVDLSYLSNHEQLWLAEYPDYQVRRYPNYNFFPSYNNVGIFQFTSTYIAGGLDGDVDLTGITDNGYKNGNPQRPVTNTPATNTGKQIHRDSHNYTVRYGDSWWKIANEHGMNMYALATLNGMTINTVIHPGQVLRVADDGQGSKVSNNINKPIPQKITSTTWHDVMGDTWHSEKGTFTLNSWVNLRWGAKTSSSLIATLALGSTIKYDAWSNHNGYTWIRQPRPNGYAYMAVRSNYNHQAYGTFK